MLKYGRPLGTVLLWQAMFWLCFVLLTGEQATSARATAALLPIVAIVASVTLGGIALALLPLSELGRRQWSGGALLLLLAADAFMTSFSGPAWLFWRYAVQYLMLAAAALFVHSLAERRLTEMKILLPLLGTILAALIVARAMGGLTALVHRLDPVAMLAFAAYVAAVLAGMARTQPKAATRIAAILSVGIAAAAVDVLLNLHMLPWRGLLATMLFPLALILWIGTELALHGFAIHREANALTRELRRNVERQAAEISEAELRIREQERLVAINVERQRLVRDMHDGAGGLLTRLLLRLRSGAVPLGEVRAEIQAAVDDLRQIIDSMDCADEGLDVALAIFRERISPRLMHEGVTLAWHDAAARPLPYVPPPRMIQIYRILQEAMTNVLKHAGASRVEMDLTSDGDGRVRLTLSDDGVGFAPCNGDDRPRSQRGLANMARRAAIIDARFDVAAAPGQGTRIALTI